MELSDKIANEVYKKYKDIGKSGKPKKDQWTLLSAFVIEFNDDIKVVSLATGTKCIGTRCMCLQGKTVNDSHAEIMARRGFLRYLYDQVKDTHHNGFSQMFSSINTENKCVARMNVNIHFFTSHVPCGDASIIPMTNEETFEVASKRKANCSIGEFPSKRTNLDIHRTGAKPLSSDPRQDPKQEGNLYHARGAVRTKPGRGDPTASLSCSDKIARWIFTGLEGALLSQLIDGPVRLTSVTVGGSGQYNETVMQDALVVRSNSAHKPKFLKTNMEFEHSIATTKGKKPCPASILWCDVKERDLEVSVDGKPLGCTKKNKDRCRLLVSKRELFKLFVSLAGEKFHNFTYLEAKLMASNYQMLSKEFRLSMGAWSIDKSHTQHFKLSPEEIANAGIIK